MTATPHASMATMPALGWDCHAHLFGPYAQFPLAPERSYAPPEAIDTQYLALLATLGLTHGVLVHPSAYADDYALLLHALAAHPQLRGVIVARADTRIDLSTLRARGVRAARFSHRRGAGANFAGSASFDDLLQMRKPLADAGLHAELWSDCKALPGIAPALRQMPFPVVIDHMGGFDVEAGVDDPGFRTLLGLLEAGSVYVKLCVYRNLPGNLHDKVSLEAARPFHDALLRANPERLLWGSDWPHLRVAPAPDAGALLQVFKEWTASATLIDQILLHNPARLYQGEQT